MTLTFEMNGPNFYIPNDIRNMLKEMGTKRYNVTLTPVYGARTARQNAFFHMLVGKIATASGGNIEYVKKCIKGHALTIGYPPAVDLNGKEILSDSGEFLPKPSHQANSREMGILIDAALHFAAEYNIDIEEEAIKHVNEG